MDIALSAIEFADTYGLSNTDRFVICKKFPNEKRSSIEWKSILTESGMFISFKPQEVIFGVEKKSKKNEQEKTEDSK